MKVWVGERVTSRMAEEGVQKSEATCESVEQWRNGSQRMKCKVGLREWYFNFGG